MKILIIIDKVRLNSTLITNLMTSFVLKCNRFNAIAVRRPKSISHGDNCVLNHTFRIISDVQSVKCLSRNLNFCQR